MGFPVDEARIAAAEAELGRRLPDELRDRLGHDNGGEIEAEVSDDSDLGDDEWQLFPVWDDSDRQRMGRTASHIVRETAQAREWDGFPAAAVAIADNGTGDKLVVLAGSDEVRWWDHETGETRPVDVDWD